MWWRFRKHRLAMVGALVVIVFYLVVLLAEFLAYADPEASDAQRGLMAPQRIHLFRWLGLPSPRPRDGRRARSTDVQAGLSTDPSHHSDPFFAPGFEYNSSDSSRPTGT